MNYKIDEDFLEWVSPDFKGVFTVPKDVKFVSGRAFDGCRGITHLAVYFGDEKRLFKLPPYTRISLKNNDGGRFILTINDNDVRVLTPQGLKPYAVRQFIRENTRKGKNDYMPILEKSLPKGIRYSKNKLPIQSARLTSTLQSMAYGIEVECILDFEATAQAVRAVIGGAIEENTDGVRQYNIKDSDGRTWGVDYEISDNIRLTMSELVTPKLNYSDSKTFSDIMKNLAAKNASVSDGCAVHVHTDGAQFNNLNDGFDNPLNRLAANTFVWQDVLFKALDVLPNRVSMCKKLEESFVDGVLAAKSPKERVGKWYGGEIDRTKQGKYHPSRNRIVNLDSFYCNGSIEFRLFNTPVDLNPEVILAYRDAATALSAVSLVGARIPFALQAGMSERESFDKALCKIGLSGEEFEGTRRILTKNLDTRVLSEKDVAVYQEKHKKYAHGKPIISNFLKKTARKIDFKSFRK